MFCHGFTMWEGNDLYWPSGMTMPMPLVHPIAWPYAIILYIPVATVMFSLLEVSSTFVL